MKVKCSHFFWEYAEISLCIYSCIIHSLDDLMSCEFTYWNFFLMCSFVLIGCFLHCWLPFLDDILVILFMFIVSVNASCVLLGYSFADGFAEFLL